MAILLQHSISSKVNALYFLCKKIGSPTVRIKIPAKAKRKLMITSIEDYFYGSPDDLFCDQSIRTKLP